MPELPEVETTLCGLKSHLEGAIIDEVILRHHQLRWPLSLDLKDKLKYQTVKNLSRRGKYLLMHLGQGTVIIHLGMSGSLRILTAFESPKAHDHVDIIFSNQSILRYTDPRRFGAVIWTNESPLQHVLLKKLGVEPLEEQFTTDYLWQKTRNSRSPIKVFIMNHRVVVGIGNIYATEALFRAGIHPQMPAHQLTKSQSEQLVQSIKEVLKFAIAQGGTTLKDFVNSVGKAGYFSQQLQVYGRAGEACLQCQSKLQSIMLGQRTTVFCCYCQPK